MPLPTDPNMTWPPVRRENDKYREWSAWYSGDTERLIEFYAGVGVDQNVLPPHTSRIRPWWKFWSRTSVPSPQTAQSRPTLHVPLAGDLAAVNSTILFSEEPRIVIPLAHEGDTPDSTAIATEDRLNFILENGNVYSRLIEASETGAALGGVFIYPGWDADVAPYPFLLVAQADQAVPEFRVGNLVSVIFWREIQRDGNIVFRHLECHEVIDGHATITHGLYQGNATVLGNKVALTSRSETASFQDTVLPFEDLDVHYIPNRRPNRLWRNSPLGMSDYAGSEGIFDALDETYGAWMRDIRLAKARLVVPQEYLTDKGEFDIDNEVYSPLFMEPAAASQGSRSMEFVQPNIRVSEYEATVVEFIERAVSNAGYSPQTFGLRIEGRAESGTALRIRENKTFLTQKRKGHYWRPAISRCLEQMLLLDVELFSTPGIDPTLHVDVALSDAVTNDPVELASVVNVLLQAKAASTEVRVKMVHPEWTKEQVDAEVARILDETAPKAVPVVSTSGGES